MSINGKRGGLEPADMFARAGVAGSKNRKAWSISRATEETVHQWPNHAKTANISIEQTTRIQRLYVDCSGGQIVVV